MGNVRLYGATSGYTELAPPAVAPDGVLSLPSGTGTIAKTTDQGLVHINTTTFSAAATVNIDGCFSATYDNYKIIVENTDRSATSVNLSMRFRVSGTTNSTTNYSFLYFSANGFNTTQINYAQNGTSLNILGDGSSSTGIGSSFDVISPFKTTKTSIGVLGMQMTASGNQSGALWWQYYNVATSFDGFSLISGGTHTGTVRVYGYKNGA